MEWAFSYSSSLFERTKNAPPPMIANMSRTRAKPNALKASNLAAQTMSMTREEAALPKPARPPSFAFVLFPWRSIPPAPKVATPVRSMAIPTTTQPFVSKQLLVTETPPNDTDIEGRNVPRMAQSPVTAPTMPAVLGSFRHFCFVLMLYVSEVVELCCYSGSLFVSWCWFGRRGRSHGVAGRKRSESAERWIYYSNISYLVALHYHPQHHHHYYPKRLKRIKVHTVGRGKRDIITSYELRMLYYYDITIFK